MPATASQHPADDRLLDFAHGRLDGADFAAIESHVATCDRCCQRIAAQPENTLIALAREARTVGLTQDMPPADAAEDDFAAFANHPRYRLLEKIGDGGMGTVYKAEHRLMNRMVAIKLIHPRLLANRDAVDRFEREVRLAASLAHPNIVVSHDADHVADRHFLVMEYVAGESLAERIKKHGPAPVQQTFEWVRQAALGLQHAHERGMAHRDIKPHNLMAAADGPIKILDFGLSRLTGDPSPAPSAARPVSLPSAATRSDIVLGTPDYIAPEQIGGARDADIRADLYSLGCTWYFLLTGKAPFGELSVPQKLGAHQRRPLPTASDLRADVPVEVDRLISRLTAKQPSDRFSEPGELVRELDELLADRARGGAPLTAARTPTTSFWRSRRGMLILGAAAIGILAIGGVIWSGVFSPAAPAPPPPRVLVMMPSEQLWYPDYENLVKAQESVGIELKFASIVMRSANVLHPSPPGIAVPDVLIGPDLSAADYDAIMFIGYGTSEFSPVGKAGVDTVRLINEFQVQKKIVSSLCAGQRALAQLGALRGKRVAPCESVRPDEITVEGGRRGDEKVIADGLVITAAGPDDALELLQAIKKSLTP